MSWSPGKPTGHRWHLAGEVRAEGEVHLGSRFIYECSRCGHPVLNGNPITKDCPA